MKAFGRCGIDPPVKRRVVGTHVVPQHVIELCQGRDPADIKGIEPALLQGAEMAFYLSLAGSIPDCCVEKEYPKGDTDHGKLFVAVAAAVIDIKFVWQAIGGDCLFQDFLEVVGIVIVEQSTTDQKPGVVIDDHDAVDAPRFPVFRDIRKITGVGLPDLSELVFLISLAVAQIRIPGRFEVIVADEPLDRIDADRSREKGFPYQVVVDLCGIHAGKFLFDPEDLCDRFIIQSAGLYTAFGEWH